MEFQMKVWIYHTPKEEEEKKISSTFQLTKPKWDQIIIKLAEPETSFCAWRGRYWQSKALQSARSKKKKRNVEMQL